MLNARPARERLLEQIRADKSLPTLGIAIAKVVQMTSSGEGSVADLTHFILSDVALTQKILRLSNTISYRTLNGTTVTTISRAIFLLGFDTIKANALAGLLVDGFKDANQAQAVRQELVKALCASVCAREIARRSRHPNNEEAAVAALFKNIGRVLVASFDHHLYDKIQVQSAATPAQSMEVCTQLLGCSFERFGEVVLHDWKIPASIINALQTTHGDQKKTNVASDWVKQAASFSDSLASILVNPDPNPSPSSTAERCKVLVKRFGTALEFDAGELQHILKSVDTEARQLATTLDVALAPISTGTPSLPVKDADIFNEFMLTSFNSQQLEAGARHASGKPMNARDLLLAGVQDTTQMLGSNQVKLSDLILLVLETLYGAMGFRFATVCLRDLQSSKFTARIAVGEKYVERQRGFQFSAQNDNTIFHLAMSNNVDLMIADAGNPKVQSILPPWHKQLLPDTRSFIILPLVIDQKPLGLFYADRAVRADEGVPADETALIKTLKGQLMSAMAKR
ncbi:MAG: HDOD domain-containing protein [Undibacterium sp.]|nr:HDOD domain-containing protein [Undibacterium sp.]